MNPRSPASALSLSLVLAVAWGAFAWGIQAPGAATKSDCLCLADGQSLLTGTVVDVWVPATSLVGLYQTLSQKARVLHPFAASDLLRLRGHLPSRRDAQLLFVEASLLTDGVSMRELGPDTVQIVRHAYPQRMGLAITD